MRKVVFAMICFSLLVSCTMTNEEKARELIEPEVTANLIKPDSYEFANMRLDSCFADCENNPEHLAFAVNIAKLCRTYKEHMSEVDEAKSKMSMYAGFPGYIKL